MVSLKPELVSASEQLQKAVRCTSLLENHSCPGASGPVPANDGSSTIIRPGPILPLISPSSPRTYIKQNLYLLIPAIAFGILRARVCFHPGNRTRLLWRRSCRSCRQSSRGHVVLRRRLWRRELLPQPTYTCPHTLSTFLGGRRPSRVKIYFDLKIQISLRPVLPLG